MRGIPPFGTWKFESLLLFFTDSAWMLDVLDKFGRLRLSFSVWNNTKIPQRVVWCWTKVGLQTRRWTPNVSDKKCQPYKTTLQFKSVFCYITSSQIYHVQNIYVPKQLRMYIFHLWWKKVKHIVLWNWNISGLWFSGVYCTIIKAE